MYQVAVIDKKDQDIRGRGGLVSLALLFEDRTSQRRPLTNSSHACEGIETSILREKQKKVLTLLGYPARSKGNGNSILAILDSLTYSSAAILKPRLGAIRPTYKPSGSESLSFSGFGSIFMSEPSSSVPIEVALLKGCNSFWASTTPSRSHR